MNARDDLAAAVAELGALPMPTGDTTPAVMKPEQHKAIAVQIGEVQPATDALIGSFAESVANVRNHEHPSWEDLYCMNLTSYMGERMAPVLKRLLDTETENARLRAEVDRLSDELTGSNLALYEEELDNARLRLALASAQRGRRELRARVAELEAAQHCTSQMTTSLGTSRCSLLVRHIGDHCNAAGNHYWSDEYADASRIRPPAAPRLRPGAEAPRHPGACLTCGDIPDEWCPDCAACRTGCQNGHVDNPCTHPNAPWRVTP